MDSSLQDWDYALPPEAIASRPAARRTDARLMCVPIAGGDPAHATVGELPRLLRPGDRLVVNDTRVMAARLQAHRQTGGAVELLLLEHGTGPVRALARPAKKLRSGEVLDVVGGGRATIVAPAVEGVVRVTFDRPVDEVMAASGSMPLPPYMGRRADERDAVRYQTVYAGPLGAVAAPTAGLHFTTELLDALAAREIRVSRVTLHVGIGTFRPLRPEDVARGTLHTERFAVSPETAAAIATTRRDGGRVIAVGTTSARTLEAATPAGAAAPEPGQGVTDLFIRPPMRVTAIDGLMTNFHLPRSSLLMLVAALVGRRRLLGLYAEAVQRGYRFYSYGDAMLLL